MLPTVMVMLTRACTFFDHVFHSMWVVRKQNGVQRTLLGEVNHRKS